MANIFVVEDSKAQAGLLRHLLVDAGHEVTIYYNGKEALDAVTTSAHPDLILSDIAMPVMDGLTLCNHIKTNPSLQWIPFVLVTASEKIDELVAGLNAMAEGYLIKPYNTKVLLDTVELLLQQKENGTLPSPEPSQEINVTIGHKSYSLKAGRGHLFEFFMIAFNNASVQTRELDERERKLKETNKAFARNIELLAASEDRFRSLVEAVPDIVYKIDSKGLFTFVNDAIINLGYEPSELVGQHFSTIMYPEDVAPSSSQHVLAHFDQGKVAPAPKLFDERRTKDRMTIGLRIRLMTKNKAPVMGELRALATESIHVEINSMGVYGVDGQSQRRYVGTVGVIRDISERVVFEKELEIARDSAVTANKAKSDFLSSMSHELRTPLNAIMGFSQLLDVPENPLNEDQKEMVKHILNGGEYLLQLIGDVLDLAKIESSDENLNIQPIGNIDSIINSAMKMVENDARGREISLTSKITSTLPIVLADQTRLRQILVNLLSNAVKYNREQGSIVVSSDNQDQYLKLSVSDTGLGISKENMANLFTPFNRLGMENGTIEGTGIGLVISKRLIENMGGRIGVDSELGKGSTFWIELLKDPHSSPDQQTPDTKTVKIDPLPCKELRLLYVEDNQVNARLMQSMLKQHENITLQIATSGEDAIEYAKVYQPDVILMDVRLPGMSGIEAALLLKSDTETDSIPVIAVTADVMPEIISQTNSAGFFSYITKPIDANKLMAELKKVAEKKVE